MAHVRRGIEPLRGMRMIVRHALGFNETCNSKDAAPRARSQRRLTTALLLSLLAHALLLSLQFGIRGLGLPGMQLPWNERRAYAPALNIRLAGANNIPGAAANLRSVAPSPPSEKNVRRTEIPSGAPAPASGLRLLRPAEKASHRMPSRHQEKHSPSTTQQPRNTRAPQRHQQRRFVSTKPHPRIVAREQPAQESFSVPIASNEPINATGTQEQAPAVAEPVPPPDASEQALAAQGEIAAQKRDEEEARQQARELEAQQLAARRLEEENLRRPSQIEALKLEEEKRHALELEAQRKAVQQLEEERQRRARQIEAERQEEENAIRQAEELEARRQAEQMAQQQAAQQREQERLQQDRRLEEARQADENARREAADRDVPAQAAPGQVLAPRADVAATSGLSVVPAQEPPPSTSGASAVHAQDSAPGDTDDGPILLSDSDLAAAKVVQLRKVDATRFESHAEQEARRRTIFGGADDDIVLNMYIDRWRHTVERNGNNPDREQFQVQGDADVTVVIRSDGSIENIIIHRSDERHALDEAVRRIAATPGQQNAFPPDLLRRYDVVEIRRVWRFGDALRILEKGE